jgi:hypothetical protein
VLDDKDNDENVPGFRGKRKVGVRVSDKPLFLKISEKLRTYIYDDVTVPER